MFTGIIEKTGIVKEVTTTGKNKTFWIVSDLAPKLKVDQSLSHNGVCLTIEEIMDGLHRVTAVEETLLKTNLGNWQNGTIVNLERCMMLNGRLDGHIVQGHIDCTAICTGVIKKVGSCEYEFSVPKEYLTLIIEKGSITINGISFTLFNVKADKFTIAVIPYTFEHTNIKELKKMDSVNIEFDMIGKYVSRILQRN